MGYEEDLERLQTLLRDPAGVARVLAKMEESGPNRRPPSPAPPSPAPPSPAPPSPSPSPERMATPLESAHEEIARLRRANAELEQKVATLQFNVKNLDERLASYGEQRERTRTPKEERKGEP